MKKHEACTPVFITYVVSYKAKDRVAVYSKINNFYSY